MKKLTMMLGVMIIVMLLCAIPVFAGWVLFSAGGVSAGSAPANPMTITLGANDIIGLGANDTIIF